MSEATPTALPWRVGDYGIFDAEGFTVCALEGRRPRNLANAAYIVKAVNNHHDLTWTMRTLLSLLAQLDTKSVASPIYEQAVAEAWKALARADGAIP